MDKKEDQKTQQGANEINSGLIVGDSKTNKATTKSSRLSLKPKKKTLFIGFILMLAIAITTAVIYIRFFQKDTPVEIVQIGENRSAIINKETQEAKAIVEQKIAQPLPKNSTNDEKTNYYRSAIMVKSQQGDNKAVADYYISEVKPSGAKFTVDVNELLIIALLESGYKQESKVLVSEVITSFQAAPQSTDTAKQSYINDKIKYYTELEKTL